MEIQCGLTEISFRNCLTKHIKTRHTPYHFGMMYALFWFMGKIDRRAKRIKIIKHFEGNAENKMRTMLDPIIY